MIVCRPNVIHTKSIFKAFYCGSQLTPTKTDFSSNPHHNPTSGLNLDPDPDHDHYPNLDPIRATQKIIMKPILTPTLTRSPFPTPIWFLTDYTTYLKNWWINRKTDTERNAEETRKNGKRNERQKKKHKDQENPYLTQNAKAKIYQAQKTRKTKQS